MRERIRKIEKKLLNDKEEINIEIRLFEITDKQNKKPGVQYNRHHDPAYPHLELYTEKKPFDVIKINPMS